MNQSIIEEFGRLLIQCVRDEAMRSCDRQLEAETRGPMAVRWREQNNDPKSIIPDSIDETIFYFLQSIDQGKFKLSFHSESGELVDLSRDGLGELAGLFMASGGWRSDYSSERFNDDFRDLA